MCAIDVHYGHGVQGMRFDAVVRCATAFSMWQLLVRGSGVSALDAIQLVAVFVWSAVGLGVLVVQPWPAIGEFSRSVR